MRDETKQILVRSEKIARRPENHLDKCIFSYFFAETTLVLHKVLFLVRRKKLTRLTRHRILQIMHVSYTSSVIAVDHVSSFLKVQATDNPFVWKRYFVKQ